MYLTHNIGSASALPIINFFNRNGFNCTATGRALFLIIALNKVLVFQPCKVLALFPFQCSLLCISTSRFLLGMLQLAGSSPWANSSMYVVLSSWINDWLSSSTLPCSWSTSTSRHKRCALFHYQLSSNLYRIQLKRSVPTRTDHKKVYYKYDFQEEESFLGFNVCLRKRRACFYPHLPSEYWTACLNYAQAYLVAWSAWARTYTASSFKVGQLKLRSIPKF